VKPENLERIADFVVSHPGNCRSLSIEVKLDEAHEVFYSIKWIGHHGQRIARVDDYDIDKAIDNFFKN
jgi:hypothetical protein